MMTTPGQPPWHDALAALVRDQDGLVSRRQLLDLGGCPADLERMLRRKELARVLPGVFVNHTGEPTWLQRAWAGVLFFWPAALAEGSAARASAGPGWRDHREDGPITIAVDVTRTVREAPGYRVRRFAGFEERVQWNRCPPRLRFEDTVIDLAARAPDRLTAIGILTHACQTRSTTAARLIDALDSRPRVAGRSWIRRVLMDVDAGTCSVLEHAFLTRVERPHHLPRGSRNAPEHDGTRRIFRDVEYRGLGLIVELDGRAFHEGAARRDADLDRDLRAAASGRATVRLGWGQVFARPCQTAAALAVLLRQHGWEGRARRCGPGCHVDASPNSNP